MRPRLSDIRLFESSLSPDNLPRMAGRDPLSAIILTLVVNSPVFFLGPAAVSAIAGAIVSTIGYGLTAALTLALQKPPPSAKPSDIQTNIRQPISPRRRIYGRFLAGSVIVFAFRRGQKSYLLHYICEGPIEGFVSFRLDKRPVTLRPDGFVDERQYTADDRSRVQILSTLGLADDEPFQAILDAFPELDDPLKPFRHRSCVMVLQICEQVGTSKMPTVYPNNMPSLQVVIDAFNNIYDPRDGTSGLTTNAGRCLLAETMDVYGFTPADTEFVNFDAFAAFCDHSDEPVPLKSGGVEPRYRATGMILANAENEERIKTIASVCNADVFIDPQGRISVRQKMRSVPGIALRAKNGDHFSIDLVGGRAMQKSFNTVKVTYLDPALNYKENEVAWRHPDLYADDGGELSEPISLLLCPSPTQALRLGKLYLHEQNPDFAGTVTSGPQALDLLEDYAFTLDLSPEDDLDRIANAIGGIEYDADAMTVSANFVVLGAGATDWVPAIDEQDTVIIPPVLPSDIEDVTLDVTPTVELAANSAPILKFAWVAAGAGVLPDSYTQELQVSAAGADDWFDASVNQDLDNAQYTAIVDGGAYDWRIRNKDGNTPFDWQNSTAPVTVVVDTTAPVALLTFSASDGTGQFSANFGTANDSHLATVAVYRVVSGGTLDRTTDRVAPPYAVAPGIGYVLPIVSAPGSFDIYAEPFNRSSIAGPLAGPAAAIVS
ncbi:hypothetical protein NKH73_14215 [Mesorhizobium sp. M0938]|uniref:hypothetical protein n=1 Tax=unclassified Mesorhizobium TaxID=325217 RepID=UPI00333BCC51